MTRFHEKEGAKIAVETLVSLGCDEKKTQKILSIVDRHDSRLVTLSLNDKLVKDVDKLWRFTPIEVDIDHTRFGLKRRGYVDYLETRIEDWLFMAAAMRMAREALAGARKGSQPF